MIPLLPYVLLHCRIALLFFCYFNTCIQRMIQHQFVFACHTGRQQAYFGSTTGTCMLQVPTTLLVKMNIDPDFVELTADVLAIFFL